MSSKLRSLRRPRPMGVGAAGCCWRSASCEVVFHGALRPETPLDKFGLHPWTRTGHQKCRHFQRRHRRPAGSIFATILPRAGPTVKSRLIVFPRAETHISATNFNFSTQTFFPRRIDLTSRMRAGKLNGLASEWRIVRQRMPFQLLSPLSSFLGLRSIDQCRRRSRGSSERRGLVTCCSFKPRQRASQIFERLHSRSDIFTKPAQRAQGDS
jgi:hypothetical protein